MKKIFKRLSVFFAVLVLSLSWITFANVGKVEASAETYYISDDDELDLPYMYNSYYIKCADFDTYGKFGSNYYWLNYEIFFSVGIDPYRDPDEVDVVPYVGEYLLLRCTRQAGTLQNQVITYVDYRKKIDLLADSGLVELTYSDYAGGSLKPNGMQATDLSRLAFNVLVLSDNYTSFGEHTSFNVDYFATDGISLGLPSSVVDSLSDYYFTGVRFVSGNYSLYVTTVDYFDPYFVEVEGIAPQLPYQILTDYGTFFDFSTSLISAPVLSFARVGSFYTSSEYLAYGESEFSRGQSVGYTSAQEDGEVLKSQTKNFLFTLFDAPVSVFSGLSDLEVFGINFGTVVSLILFTLLLAGIMRFL